MGLILAWARPYFAGGGLPGSLGELDAFVASEHTARWGSPTATPGALEILRDVAISALVFEVLFYYAHRILHEVDWLYRTVHSTHHYHTHPVAWTGVHCSPTEMLVANVFPAAAGPVLLGSHPVTRAFWWFIAIVTVVTTHSGLCLPCMPNARMHDAHHELSGECFGSLGILDALHGTNRRFMKRQEADGRRHGWGGTDPMAVLLSAGLQSVGLRGLCAEGQVLTVRGPVDPRLVGGARKGESTGTGKDD